MFEKLRSWRTSSSSERPNIRLLPEDTRYALQYRMGQIGKKEVTTLIKSGFTDESIYMIASALRDDRNILKDFLNEVSCEAVSNNEDESLEQILKDYCSCIDEDKKILAAKLSQINRIGFEHWQTKIENIAVDIKDMDCTPVLAAYGSLTGLRTFVKTFSQSETPLYILEPNRLEEEYVGYEIEISQQCVRTSTLDNNFPRPERYIFFDDTCHDEPTVLRDMWRFWHKDDSDLDFSKVRVIDKVPNHLRRLTCAL